MTNDIHDALVKQIGAAFEASGHRYDTYLIGIAADETVKVIEAWTAKEPTKATRKAKSSG
jgi:hypothetical protein